jgi:hypothetical protein
MYLILVTLIELNSHAVLVDHSVLSIPNNLYCKNSSRAIFVTKISVVLTAINEVIPVIKQHFHELPIISISIDN